MSVPTAGLIPVFLYSAAFLSAVVVASPAVAADTEESAEASTADQITIPVSDLEDIRRELEAVKAQNALMRDEIDVIHAEATRDWMTEQRAEQIKELVQDVLADADTRSSLLGSGLMAGWSDGFFLASADGRFRLNIGALVQTRLLVNILDGNEGAAQQQDSTRWGFENTTTRMNLGGYVFSDTDFFIEMGFGRTDPYGFTNDPQAFGTRLYEGWIRQRLTDNIAVKAGLFKLPFTREFLVYEGLQLAVDRSLIDWRFGLGRSQGIEIDGVFGPIRTQVAYTDGSSALFFFRNTRLLVPPWAAYEADTEWAATGRLEWLIAGEWEQFKQFTSPSHEEFGMMFGIAGHGQEQERDRTTTNPKPQLYGVTGDLSMDFGGASLFASLIYEHQVDPDAGGNIDSLDYWGLVVQGSFYVDPKWEIYSRYQIGGPFNQQLDDPEAGGGIDTQGVSILTVGVNWYIDGQDVKWTTDFGVSFDPITGFMTSDQAGWRADPDNHHAQFLIRSQLQLMF
ncbi:MAG: hypothetical protein VX527_03020 [Planctomycetota bacterium]|nr:hypothetical protein [Planctomycetota bacterium]